MQLAMLVTFSQRLDDERHVAALGQALGHVPAFWRVDADVLAAVRRLFDAPPRVQGCSAYFTAQVEGIGDRWPDVRSLLEELAVRCNGKRVLLGAEAPLDCVLAVAGDRESVMHAVAKVTEDQVEVQRRTASLGALASDGAVGDFGRLALAAIQDVGGDAAAVDWSVVEAQFMMCSQGIHPPEAVIAVLSDHSPGATSRLRQYDLSKQILSIQGPAIATAPPVLRTADALDAPGL